MNQFSPPRKSHVPDSKQVFEFTIRSEHSSRVRQKLLEAAGGVFADRGYTKATVRQICRQAGVNVAAIKYYFGDKERLYREVINHWAEISREKYPTDLSLTGDATAEERLGAFVRSFLFRLLDKSQPGWHGKLIAREMTEPTQALIDLIDEVYRPLTERLETIIRELIGPSATLEIIRRCTQSVLGQCTYYRHARPVIQRMTPEQRFESDDIEQLAKHITEFSLAGIREVASR
jgi:AcrR family transcriptional regulator